MTIMWSFTISKKHSKCFIKHRLNRLSQPKKKVSNNCQSLSALLSKMFGTTKMLRLTHRKRLRFRTATCANTTKARKAQATEDIACEQVPCVIRRARDTQTSVILVAFYVKKKIHFLQFHKLSFSSMFMACKLTRKLFAIIKFFSSHKNNFENFSLNTSRNNFHFSLFQAHDYNTTSDKWHSLHLLLAMETEKWLPAKRFFFVFFSLSFCLVQLSSNEFCSAHFTALKMKLNVQMNGVEAHKTSMNVFGGAVMDLERQFLWAFSYGENIGKPVPS